MPQQIVTPPDVGAQPPMLDRAASAALSGTPLNSLGAIGAPPDPYADDAQLLKDFEAFRKESFDQRQPFERAWWRNLLYVLSRQWIYYDADRGQWRDKRLAKWIPRPVTNKMAETVDAITSVFQSVNLAASCRPDGGSPQDVQTAETCNRLAPAIDYEHDMETVQNELDFWLITTGNCFSHAWWDKRGGRAPVTVPYEQCAGCGQVYAPDQVIAAGNQCPSCGSPLLKPAVGEDGQPMQQTLETGRGCTDALSPFEVAFPMSYMRFSDLPGLIRKRWRTRDWAEKNLPAEIVAKIQWEQMTADRSLQLLRGLAVQSDTGSNQLGSLGAGSEGNSEGFTEYEWWAKPSEKYPRGLLLRVAGEGETGSLILRLPEQSVPGPLPYETADGKPLFPWFHTPYSKFGGRIWGRSPLEVLIQKQDQLNQLDSLTQLIVQRVANPVWLEPKGTEVRKFTGEPGLVVRYNPLALGGAMAKPERIEGQNVPASIFQIRQQILNDIEQLAGTFDIIKGQKPSGVEAFSALQLLVERSQSRYGPVLAARGETYRQWFSAAIELERQFGPQERTWAVLGPNARWTYQTFKQADLQGAVTVIVEDGSQMPKTSLGKRAAIEQLKNLGVIKPENPDTGYAILQAFGQTELWPGLDYDVKSALQEQDDFERWAATVQIVQQMQPVADPTTGQPAVDPATGQPAMQPQPGLSAPPPCARKPWHNDQVHLAEHKKWANGDNVRQLLASKPFLEQYVGWMIQQHEYYLSMQAQANAEPPKVSFSFKDLTDPEVRMLFERMEQIQGRPAPAAGGAQPDKGAGAGRAMQNSNTESGNPGDVPRGQNTDAGKGQMGPA